MNDDVIDPQKDAEFQPAPPPEWRAWANVETTVEMDGPTIAKSAGGSGAGLVWERGRLYVPDVHQAALDAVDMAAVAAAHLTAVKAELQRAVDKEAEAQRLKYITAGAGQAMTYQQKAAEALRMVDDLAPDPVGYPMLAAEVGLTAADLAGVGAVVRAAHAQWLTIGTAIETARLGAKAAIDLAEDEAAARAVTPAWPSS